MILTLTLNPAVDKTVKMSNFKIDEVNRVQTMRIDAAGKGINVSKVINELKAESTALGIIAGNNGKFIKEYLDSKNINNDFETIDDETRVNLKIIDTLNNTYTDINEKGPYVSQENIQLIKKKIFKYASEKNILILSGSVPQGFSKSIYREIIEEVKQKGTKVILDVDGDLFAEGIKAGPYVVKPNIHELEKALNINIKDNNDIIKAAREIIGYGVKIVAVSLGSEGSIFVTDEKILLAKGIKVEVKSTVGAGDSMVAAIAVAIEKEYSLEDTLKLAAAVSTANVMTEGTQTGNLKDVTNLQNKIEIIQI